MLSMSFYLGVEYGETERHVVYECCRILSVNPKEAKNRIKEL